MGVSANTFAEALEKLLPRVTELKLLPDADDELIAAIEEAIIGWYREPIENSMANGTSSVQSSPADAGGGMGGVGASQIAGMGTRGLPGGGMPGAPGGGAPMGGGGPSMDAMRQMMSGPSGMR